MEEWKYIIKGRVQGVGFRANVLYYVNANKLPLVGYVKNKLDRSVEVMAQGENLYLKQLEEFLRSAPGISRVDELIIDKRKPTRTFHCFSID